MKNLDGLCINTIRMLSVDMVQQANSGHPGMPMGTAPMAYVLWTKFLRHNPNHPRWPDRDRFVLSAGHGSALLYSLLHLTGYDLSIEELKRFRQWGSKTPGHPEYGETPGVECTTGPLGQGFGNGVGMAIAERFLAVRFNRPGYEIVNHYTYAIVSDGDLMEGVASEAASLAGHLKLGKLIYLYDNNYITLAGERDLPLRKMCANVLKPMAGMSRGSMMEMTLKPFQKQSQQPKMKRFVLPSFRFEPTSVTAAPVSRIPLRPTGLLWALRRSLQQRRISDGLLSRRFIYRRRLWVISEEPSLKVVSLKKNGKPTWSHTERLLRSFGWNGING